MVTYSKFQQAIFDRVPNLKIGENLVVMARAGSGKTFTAIEAANRLPEAPTIFLAFNKSIAQELSTRVPKNVEATTLNSFGWRICQRNLNGRPRISEFKTLDILKNDYNHDEELFYKIRGAVKQTVGLMKAWAFAPTVNGPQIMELMDKYGVEPPENVPAAVLVGAIQSTYSQSLRIKHTLDFDDQLLFPVIFDMAVPEYRYVFIDEAQDLNPCQIALVTRLGRKGSIIAIGDDKQAIYGFRGADPDALPNLICESHAEVLPLSICYRCPKKVIELAQQIVPDIEAAPDAKDGVVKNVSLEDMSKMWTPGDYIICRTTAPLVGQCLKLIRDGRRAIVLGRDIKEGLTNLIDKAVQAYPTFPFERAIQCYRDELLDKYERMNKESHAVLLNDKCDTILAIWEDGAKDAVAVKRRLEEIFAERADSSYIIFCSVHKSKGLEAERIFILRMDLMPHPAAKLKWQHAQEMNLKYVALTRSLSELYLESTKTEKRPEYEIQEFEIETL